MTRPAQPAAAAPPPWSRGRPRALTGPPLRPQGCSASLPRRPCGPALTPETSAAPAAGRTRAGQACPAGHAARPATSLHDHATTERTTRDQVIPYPLDQRFP